MDRGQDNNYPLSTLMEQFRIKLILKDGRGIYLTDKCQYQLVDAGALASSTVKNLIAHGAYTPTLSLFVMGGARPDYIHIATAELEPIGSPLDATAFVLGGRRAS
jgi:hypothetical protein